MFKQRLRARSCYTWVQYLLYTETEESRDVHFLCFVVPQVIVFLVVPDLCYCLQAKLRGLGFMAEAVSDLQ